MSINFSKKTAVSTKELFRQAEFDNILKCVHCGLCLESCPTYRELEDEKDSPRGRLYLMRGLWEGELCDFYKGARIRHSVLSSSSVHLLYVTGISDPVLLNLCDELP